MSASGTSITFNEASPDPASSGGQALGDHAATINLNPSGGNSAGLVFIYNKNFDFGGIRYTVGKSEAQESLRQISRKRQDRLPLFCLLTQVYLP